MSFFELAFVLAVDSSDALARGWLGVVALAAGHADEQVSELAGIERVASFSGDPDRVVTAVHRGHQPVKPQARTSEATLEELRDGVEWPRSPGVVGPVNCRAEDSQAETATLKRKLKLSEFKSTSKKTDRSRVATGAGSSGRCGKVRVPPGIEQSRLSSILRDSASADLDAEPGQRVGGY
ncbi:hypothetical protein [Glycomyces arizonensis]|uniref:hypothetical protein n=1 Tax=Glycomyces arizonensis TaxID=256035 RepID=UPI00146F96C6|nr:hypothetical protein [Glycomyces arizonensis]